MHMCQIMKVINISHSFITALIPVIPGRRRPHRKQRFIDGHRTQIQSFFKLSIANMCIFAIENVVLAIENSVLLKRKPQKREM